MHGGIYRCTGIYFFKSAKNHVKDLPAGKPISIPQRRASGQEYLDPASSISSTPPSPEYTQTRSDPPP